MSIDDITKVVDIFAKLLGVIVWPIVIIFILFRFGRSIGELISSLTEFSVKGAGFEASGKRKTEAAAALGAALAKQQGASPDASTTDPRRAGQIVDESVTPRIFRQANRSHVLWVDDRPTNNIFERRSLEALGINITLAKSTEEAIERVKEKSFDVIISDMSRPGDSNAGFTLLDKLRTDGNNTPYIIYGGSRVINLRAEARQKRALGATNRPDELFELVLLALGKFK
jgi:CheY-like chemotaxis protein